MSNRNKISRLFAYIVSYGKPEQNEDINILGLLLSTLLLAFLTGMAIRFGVTFLCIFLAGEYKENFEYWRHAFNY